MELEFFCSVWAFIVVEFNDLAQFVPINKREIHGCVIELWAFIQDLRGSGDWIVKSNNRFKVRVLIDWVAQIIKVKVLRVLGQVLLRISVVHCM